MNPILNSLLLPDRRALIFATKGVVSMALALLAAMWLGLERPYWAVVSAVFLQVRPETGLVIQKGFIQVGGTIVGTLVGIAILATLMSYPEIALVCVGLWIGLNSALSSTVRSINYTYGFAMAGMSAALVVLLTVADASQTSSTTVFAIARARVSELVLGACCAVLVSQLLWPVSVKQVLRQRGRVLLNETLEYMMRELDCHSTHSQRHKQADTVLECLMVLSDDVSGVAFEGPQGPGRARAANSLCNRTMSVMASVQILGRFQRNHADQVNPWFSQWLNEIRQQLQPIQSTSDYNEALQLSRSLRQGIREFIREKQFETALEQRMAGIISELLEDLIVALVSWQAVEEPDGNTLKASSIESWRDWVPAAVNATRSMAMFGAGALIWMATGSQAAIMLMVMPVVFSIMFAHLPTLILPKVIFSLVLGVMLASVVGMALLGLLAESSGTWEILVMLMAAAFFPGLLLLANRPTLPFGLGFLIPLTIIIQPGNDMTFNAATALSTAMGIITGVIILLGLFRLITPPSAEITRRRLLKATVADLKALTEHGQTADWFNSRMGDRLLKLAMLDQLGGKHGDDRVTTDLGLTGLNLGHVAMRLKRNLAELSDNAVVSRLYRDWLNALGETLLNSAEGKSDRKFEYAAMSLQAGLERLGANESQRTMIEGMNNRLGKTFERISRQVRVGQLES